VAFLCGIIGIVLSGLGFSHKKRQERKMKYYSATIFVYVVGGSLIIEFYIMILGVLNFIIPGFTFLILGLKFMTPSVHHLITI
jgi:hypothetical protein